MSGHPWDWLIHAGLCGLAFYFDQVSILAILIVGLIVEYEQKFQTWYTHYTWFDYIKKHAFGDMLANCVGILIAFIIKSGVVK